MLGQKLLREYMILVVALSLEAKNFSPAPLARPSLLVVRSCGIVVKTAVMHRTIETFLLQLLLQ